MQHTHRCESVFAHTSFQFCGHADEHLIATTHHLTLIRFQTRFGKDSLLLESQTSDHKSKKKRTTVIFNWSKANFGTL